MAGQSVVVSVLADTKQFGSAMSGAGGQVGGFGKALKGLAGVAAAAFSVKAITDFTRKAIDSASSLQQSIGGVEAVFKDQAAAVNDFAKNAAQAAGLSRDSYNQLATIIGTSLKNTGTPMDELAGKTNDLVSRASDLAATFGGSVSEATTAVGAALRGEFEPLRRYGVSLSVADINARALADSGKASADELTKQEKALATQALIFEQSADAAGQFGRESDTLAGKQERLRATWENMSAQIGGALLPLVSGLVGAFGGLVSQIASSDTFSSVLESVGAFFTSLFDGSSQLGSFASQILELVVAFSPLGMIIRAITPLLPTLLEAFSGLAEAIGGALMTALPLLLPPLLQLADVFAGVLATVLPIVVQLVTVLAEALGPLLTTVIGALAPVIVTLVEALAPIIAAVGQLIGALLPPLIQLFGGILSAVMPVVTLLLNALVPVLQFVATALGAVIKWIVQAITNVINFGKTVASLAPAVGREIGKILDFFGSIPKRIGEFFSGAGKWLYNVGRDIINGLLNGAGSLLRGIGNFFLNLLPGWIVGPFKAALGIASPSKVFRGFGTNVIEGLVGGLVGGLPALASAMGDVSGVVSGTFEATPSGSLGGARGSGRIYEIRVEALAPSPAIGRAVLEAIEDYERLGK